jgi:hypothetical protein
VDGCSLRGSWKIMAVPSCTLVAGALFVIHVFLKVFRPRIEGSGLPVGSVLLYSRGSDEDLL